MAALEARSAAELGQYQSSALRGSSLGETAHLQHAQGQAGARPGHLGHRQALLEPTEVIEVQLPACGCGQTTFHDARPYDTHQVIELPDIQMSVQQFVLYAGALFPVWQGHESPGSPSRFLRRWSPVHGPAG